MNKPRHARTSIGEPDGRGPAGDCSVVIAMMAVVSTQLLPGQSRMPARPQAESFPDGPYLGDVRGNCQWNHGSCSANDPCRSASLVPGPRAVGTISINIKSAWARGRSTPALTATRCLQPRMATRPRTDAPGNVSPGLRREFRRQRLSLPVRSSSVIAKGASGLCDASSCSGQGASPEPHSVMIRLPISTGKGSIEPWPLATSSSPSRGGRPASSTTRSGGSSRPAAAIPKASARSTPDTSASRGFSRRRCSTSRRPRMRRSPSCAPRRRPAVSAPAGTSSRKDRTRISSAWWTSFGPTTSAISSTSAAMIRKTRPTR